VVRSSGALLVAAAPTRPVEDPCGVAGLGPDEGGEQPVNLGDGDRQQVRTATQAATPPLGWLLV
jgi:hypothetical protein